MSTPNDAWMMALLVACAAGTYAALPPCPQAAGATLLLACGAGVLLRDTPPAAAAAGVQLGALVRLLAAAALGLGWADTEWAATVLAACVVGVLVVASLHGAARTKKNL